MAKRKRLTDKQRKALRVFASEPDSGEPQCFCGSLGDPDLKMTIGSTVFGLIDDLLNGHRDYVDINIQVVKMTDKQVRELPEL